MLLDSLCERIIVFDRIRTATNDDEEASEFLTESYPRESYSNSSDLSPRLATVEAAGSKLSTDQSWPVALRRCGRLRHIDRALTFS